MEKFFLFQAQGKTENPFIQTLIDITEIKQEIHSLPEIWHKKYTLETSETAQKESKSKQD